MCIEGRLKSWNKDKKYASLLAIEKGGGDTFEPDTSTAQSFGAVVPGLDCKGSGNALKLNEVKAR